MRERMKFERISETAYFNPDKNTVITVEYNTLKINGQSVKTYSSPADALKDLNQRIALWNAVSSLQQQNRYY